MSWPLWQTEVPHPPHCPLLWTQLVAGLVVKCVRIFFPLCLEHGQAWEWKCDGGRKHQPAWHIVQVFRARCIQCSLKNKLFSVHRCYIGAHALDGWYCKLLHASRLGLFLRLFQEAMYVHVSHVNIASWTNPKSGGLAAQGKGCVCVCVWQVGWLDFPVWRSQALLNAMQIPSFGICLVTGLSAAAAFSLLTLGFLILGDCHTFLFHSCQGPMENQHQNPLNLSKILPPFCAVLFHNIIWVHTLVSLLCCLVS
jgi:hypothetical protein